MSSQLSTHIITSLLDLSPKVDWQRKTEALDKFSAAYTSSSLRVSSSEMAQLNVFFSVCLGDLRSSLIRSALDCLVNVSGRDEDDLIDNSNKHWREVGGGATGGKWREERLE